MKHLFILFAFVLSSSTLFSQQNFESYYSEYFKMDFKIDIDKNNFDVVSFWINAMPLDQQTKKISIKASERELKDFKEFLISSKSIFAEWRKISLDNKVEKIYKEIENKRLMLTIGFINNSDWEFSYNAVIVSYFVILEGKDPILMIRNNLNLKSTKNESTEGFAIVFSSVDEIDDFVDKLDFNKAKEQLNKN